MFKTWTVLVLLIVVNPLHAREKGEYYQIISQAWDKKDYTLGYESMQQAVKEYPATLDFQYSLAYFAYYTKNYLQGIAAGEKAYQLDPKHEHAVNSYKINLTARGWQLNEEKNYDEMYVLFKKAYELDPEDEWNINAYGYALKTKKEYKKAISLLTEGLKKYPAQKYIRGNLIWTYWDVGDAFYNKERMSDAYDFFQRALQTADTPNFDLTLSYLYRLPKLDHFQEMEETVQKAQADFPQEQEKLYPAIYWNYHYLAQHYKNLGQIPEMIDAFKKLYAFSLTQDQVWQENKTYQYIAIINFYFSTVDVMNKICHYYQKFTPAQRKKAYQYSDLLARGLAPELQFIHKLFLGSALYRDNQVEKARAMLTQGYQSFVDSRLGQKYPLQKIEIPFPLKGYYYTFGNQSKAAITHMGMNQYCYDITGADGQGRTFKPQTQGKVVEDFFGFGQTIYSPVEGEVIDTADHYPDASPSSTPPSPEGNYIFIKKDDKIYSFVHLKKNSVKIKKGDKVTIGQPLAELGNSGSTIPHLHFGVYSDDWLVSYPVYFRGYYQITDGKKVWVASGRPGLGDSMGLMLSE